jgi:cell division protein FtsB
VKEFRARRAIRTILGLILLILAVFFVFQTISGPNGVSAVLEKRREIRDLQEQNANLARENELRRQRIMKLRESRSEQELEIRRRLKLLKQKETTFIIQDRQK